MFTDYEISSKCSFNIHIGKYIFKDAYGDFWVRFCILYSALFLQDGKHIHFKSKLTFMHLNMNNFRGSVHP